MLRVKLASQQLPAGIPGMGATVNKHDGSSFILFLLTVMIWNRNPANALSRTLPELLVMVTRSITEKERRYHSDTQLQVKLSDAYERSPTKDDRVLVSSPTKDDPRVVNGEGHAGAFQLTSEVFGVSALRFTELLI
ncbi:hypothetical protein EYF80_055847 [Liparis tanakae]|uniref:Uncharacterized protein n=1 Tax=Liparis tanakae TaxID=230148 RepID=A0A4Z2EYP8_9TELE|nr:hypothetical protein EYF80_055847 [Liparis tanakae]